MSGDKDRIVRGREKLEEGREIGKSEIERHKKKLDYYSRSREDLIKGLLYKFKESKKSGCNRNCSSSTDPYHLFPDILGY